MIQIEFKKAEPRIIESSELDRKGLLRPLLLFRGGMTEGRARSLWNIIVTAKDSDVQSVTDLIKTCKVSGEYRHLCGLHSDPQNMTINSIICRINSCKKTADLIPGLWEYSRHLLYSSGATKYTLDPIPAYSTRTKRPWRTKWKDALPENYPYISGRPTRDHDLLLAIDDLVPKGLPDATRSDVCQDMVVAVLSGEVTLDNLHEQVGIYLRKFWKMFPDKYGHVSLDAPMRDRWGAEIPSLWSERLSAKTSRLL